MTSTNFEDIAKKVIGKIKYNKLIKRYGCIDNVIKQSKESLCNVVSEKDAEYINNLIDFKFTAIDQLKKVNNSYDTYEHLMKYCRMKNEIFVCIYINRCNDVICEEITHIGVPSSCLVDVYGIVNRGKDLKAKGLIVAHNHPSNHPVASEEDIKLTKNLSLECKKSKITLFDSIIITNKECVSIMHQQNII
tara:strand:+ start:8320 stop:8892 length:573 start_codon:yes stop_codon:yes gene_type:complete